MPYNPTIHHRQSIRLKEYDYSQAGMYFVTICVQNREHLFGKIINGEMMLNEAGKIVCEEWIKSAEIRREIEIHEYIIMPNHFHAIVEIVSTVGANGIRPDNSDNVGNSGECHSPLRSPSKTLGALIRGFKSSVTKRLGFSPWQRNYYEQIIRNDQSHQDVENYIINNPMNWKDDPYYEQF
ncbi:MAG: transposase [Tannerella sp.]|jgi:REP element-mobilizing transposase RayT|nr:transposase [Tannerella sp.]